MRWAMIVLLILPAFAQEPAPPQPTTNEDFARAVYFGKKFADMKEYASSYEQFAKADALKPDQPAVLYDMAVVLAKAGRYSEAQGRVDRYLQLYPTGAERPLIGKLQLELEFQRELQKKKQADQDYVELFNRGKFNYGKGDLDAALKSFLDAEQQRPNDPAAVYNEAVILEKQGEIAKAVERFHRYQELEPEADAKAAIDQRLFALETEIEDMKTKIVCSFCGLRLANGATWCHRCWHGPYPTTSAVWNTRPCVDGASATRATYFGEDRFNKNDSLPCLMQNGTMLETLRYTPSRQRAIQDARKAEGWTYNGEFIQGIPNQVRFVQGTDYLEKMTVPATGDILGYAAHKAGDAWLLDREDAIIEGQKYTSRYTFDAGNRMTQQQVDYVNTAACDHLVSMTADYAYTNDALVSVKIRGGYDGYQVEGAPKTEWTAQIGYSYDAKGRVTGEELSVMSFAKTYTQKPYGAMRDEISRIYPAMRVRRPLEGAIRGDFCATAGNALLGNPIDLRPFYAMSPNLAMALPYGVQKAVVSFTYPDAFKVR